MDDRSLSSQVADFVCGRDAAAITSDMMHALKFAVIDCVSAMLGGLSEDVSNRVVAHVLSRQSQGEATIVGHSDQTTIDGAALANGTMGHASDYDDICLSMWGHVTAPILPAVLAVCENKGMSGRELLIALNAGIEVAAKLGAALAPRHLELGWHPTSTVGVIGAAVGAAKALGLSHEATKHALGLASSRAAGIRENFGTMTKALHVGFAARDGLEAALLSAKGITAAATALDGPFGFLTVFAPEQINIREMGSEIAHSLGRPYEILDPGLYFKLYPSCSDTHTAIDAILEIKNKFHLDPNNVRAIRCGISALAASNLIFHQPQTPLEAKFSMEYCLAISLLRGRLSLKDFDRRDLSDGSVTDLIRRTTVGVDQEFSDIASYLTPASVEIDAADGCVLTSVVRIARGHPERPLSNSELEGKFLACAEPLLTPNAARCALDLLWHLETVTDVRALLKQLGTARC